ncbi:class I SAM-dependent methyltransferase [Candidatus Sumerlaeota bacterium]|nr:class I SAM-dependent methyltransferase [Candidatus Sumerlaeota bacterium]
MKKSSVEEIRARFDKDVERFANVETGQSATIDAPLVLNLISGAAAAINPHAKDLLDVGCGAGNYSLKLLTKIPNMNVTLVDLSEAMLRRAHERVASETKGSITTVQCDVRSCEFPAGRFDVITAAAVLHHLRSDEEWHAVFASFHHWLRPGGSLWISDLVVHEHPAVHGVMWQRYGEYLTNLKGAKYRDDVFSYIEKEDTPRSLPFQLGLLGKVGFTDIDVLHKNSCFAAFGAIKA